ncbi:uncharacterized protein LODBEIA_P37970 [Lodderomyces beijingensis]|uniref:Autophagy-related protein 33 n=1 Tax=Lodderomyces beijingensis TaxID=1775926 RepID=A0ABP0ZPG9_9ASCO
MAGTCISTIKVLGLGSLGLLTTSIIYQSIQNIPQLINQINSIYQFNLSQLNHQIYKTKTFILGSRIVNGLLTGLSTVLFSLAFKYSSADEKHPYLIYAAIGAPLSLLGLYYNAWFAEDKILSKDGNGSFLKQQKKKHTKFASSTTTVTNPSSVATPDIDYEEGEVQDDEEDDESAEVISKVNTADELGRSYVHLSDESGISTPTSTQPPSPTLKHQEEEEAHGETSQQPQEAKPEDENEVDTEIETTLLKKEVVQDLQHIQSGYTVASYVSGISLTLAVVGLFGDFYFV